ncbi:MAG: tetratricopeptide repeat protein [Mariprofundus sp.]|nr:tetratricopeptide repeat protein [Mariprofundus sp.]
MAMQSMDTRFLYLAAQSAMKEGNHALAIELLETLVKKDPKAIDPHIQLTTLLLTNGQTDKTKEHLETLFAEETLQPGQLEQIQLTRIRLYLAESRSEQALDAITGFLKTHPSHIQARDLQARILSSQKRFDEALAAINAAIRNKDLPEFRQLQAQLLVKKGDITSAKASLTRMQEMAPDDDTPVLMLSALALKEKNNIEAEKVLRAFMADHPEALNVSLALGKLMVQKKRLVEAILVYRDIASRSGNNPEVLRQLGMLYFQHQDYTEAEKTFRNLVGAHPDDINRFYLAASLEALDRSSEAKDIYEQIDDSSPMAIDTQIRLAAIDISQNKLDEASKRLQNVMKTKPVRLDAHLMLSAIRLSRKQYRQLLDETEKLMGINNLPARLLFNRAAAFDHFKQYEQVEAMLNRIISRQPNDAEALNFLGYTYAVQGMNLNKAIALIKLALIQKPDDGYYLDSLAWAYYKKGDYPKAAITQTRALKKVTDDAVMYDHYGDIMWKNSRPKAARQAWQKAIELKFEHPRQLKQKIKEGLK